MDRGCSVCDLEEDGEIELGDLAIFASYWLDTCDSDAGCWKSDFDGSADIDFADFAQMAMCWKVKDDVPPMPNAAEWAYGGEPAIVLTEDVSPDTIEVKMSAKRAVDAWTGTNVQYRFKQVVPEGVAGIDSEWIVDNTFSVEGLNLNSTYKFVVRARDDNGNETDDSKVGFVWTSGDIYPPEVKGIGEIVLTGEDFDGTVKPRAEFAFEIEIDTEPDPDVETMVYLEDALPYASADVGATYALISMTAQVGVDPQGTVVEYSFERINPDTGQTDALRDWATAENGGLTWTDGEDPDNRLVEDETYTYIVKMRDAAGNVSAPSDAQIAIAEIVADDMDTEAPPIPVWNGEVLRWDCDQLSIIAGDCEELGTYWDSIEVLPSVDPQGFEVEYWFEEVNSGDNSGWIIDPFWTSETIPFETRDYMVKARDTSQRQNESVWSPVLSNN